MMQTANEILTEMYKVVNNSPLKAAINGAVYKSWRPHNSNKEDVVVNIVTSDAELVQTAVCNVNIHIPTLVTAVGPMPNGTRFDALAAIAKNILEKGYTNHYTFYTEQTAQVKEQDRDVWFLNFRIIVKYHNTINL